MKLPNSTECMASSVKSQANTQKISMNSSPNASACCHLPSLSIKKLWFATGVSSLKMGSNFRKSRKQTGNVSHQIVALCVSFFGQIHKILMGGLRVKEEWVHNLVLISRLSS